MDRLIGVTVADDDGAISVNSYRGSRFQCIASGLLTTVKVYAGATGNVVAAIYSDDAGNNRPGTLLSGNPDGWTALAATGWQDVLVKTAVEITLGTYYWIIANTSTANLLRYGAGGKLSYYDVAWGTFPADGGSFATLEDFPVQLQGWGNALAATGRIIMVL